MAHGYLREFDEDRGEGRSESERNTNFMIREREDLEHDRDHGGFFGSISNQARGHGSFERASRNFRSNQDDHYLSWRAKQIEALDRDYADYCEEREQQFHQDFDNWRLSRRPADQHQDELLLNTPRALAGAETPSKGSVTAQATLDPQDAATLGATGE